MKFNLLINGMFLVIGIVSVVGYLTVGASTLALIVAILLIAVSCLSIGLEIGYYLAKEEVDYENY